VYNKATGKILAIIPDNQKIERYYYHYSEDFKNNLATLECENTPRNIVEYRVEVENGKLVKMTELEMQEMQKYRRILTEEERVLELLKPSEEEIRKAENTIEILTLLQEVI